MKKNNNYNQFALLLCATVLFLWGCSSQNAKHSSETPAVSVVTLKEEPYTLTTELPGRTRSYRVAEVRPQVGGIILKRQFVEGSDVQAGQSLYQIDPSLYQAAYDSAKGDLAKAEANAEIQHLTVKRYKPLLPSKFVSKQDYDTAVANAKEADAAVLAAKASVENARINLFFTKVNSPISGRIGRSNVTEGALVTPSQPAALAAVNQLDPIFVDVTQSSTDYLRLKHQLTKGLLKKGSDSVTVELFLEDGDLYNLKGRLQFSEVTVDETTGSITLRAIFPNPNHVLLPGMFVRARVTEGINERAVLAPQQGITRNARGEAVALIVDEDNKVVERTLVTGQAVAGKWLIIKGLKAGDRLIVEGQLKIKPGMIVKPEEREIALPKEVVSESVSSTGKS